MTQSQDPYPSILFVCLGNICRSPLAEGFARAHAARLNLAADGLDSAGLADWHHGKPPNPRAIAVAADHGIDLTAQRSRPIRASDFSAFDIILAMDQSVLDELAGSRTASMPAHLALYLDFAGEGRRDVPDPYYGTEKDYEAVARTIAAVTPAIFERATGLRAD